MKSYLFFLWLRVLISYSLATFLFLENKSAYIILCFNTFNDILAGTKNFRFLIIVFKVIHSLALPMSATFSYDSPLL